MTEPDYNELLAKLRQRDTPLDREAYAAITKQIETRETLRSTLADIEEMLAMTQVKQLSYRVRSAITQLNQLHGLKRGSNPSATVGTISPALP